MCGRYRRTTSEEELARRYHIPIPAQRDLPISWNIAPTQDVLTIRLHPETKQRTSDTLRWGLIPNWAKDPKVAYKTINARAETVDTAPSFRQAFTPASGFTLEHDHCSTGTPLRDIVQEIPGNFIGLVGSYTLRSVHFQPNHVSRIILGSGTWLGPEHNP
jgi:hypothetical protein